MSIYNIVLVRAIRKTTAIVVVFLIDETESKLHSKVYFQILYYYWLSSLEFLVLCSKSLYFHVPLLRHESTYKIYDNGYLLTIVHEILV